MWQMVSLHNTLPFLERILVPSWYWSPRQEGSASNRRHSPFIIASNENKESVLKRVFIFLMHEGRLIRELERNNWVFLHFRQILEYSKKKLFVVWRKTLLSLIAPKRPTLHQPMQVFMQFILVNTHFDELISLNKTNSKQSFMIDQK